MALQFTTAEHESTTHGIKCMVYGPAGMGKTVLNATMPNPVMISAESGALSLSQKNLERIFGVGHPWVTYNMPIIVVKTIDDLKDAFRYLTESAEATQFQSCGLDSLSEIAEVVLNAAKRTVKDPRQAYGELIEKMETVVRDFRDIKGKNVLFLSKMEPMKDELTGVVKYGPMMPGAKLGVKMPYFFDEVFRYGISKAPDGSEFRFLQTQPDLQYEAKDRSGALDKTEYPMMWPIFDKIKGVQPHG
ncbi:MAG TPA: ATP-binding protein [Nitrospira sp.]|nr:ATP-binding protein [Nitrospira sp.]